VLFKLFVINALNDLFQRRFAMSAAISHSYGLHAVRKPGKKTRKSKTWNKYTLLSPDLNPLIRVLMKGGHSAPVPGAKSCSPSIFFLISNFQAKCCHRTILHG